MTRGSLTTFSIANDVAKYFAIIPAAFAATYPQLNTLNIMRLHSPSSAILSAVIFNAVVIIALIPLALRGVKYRPLAAAGCCATTCSSMGSAGSSCRSPASRCSTSSSPHSTSSRSQSRRYHIPSRIGGAPFVTVLPVTATSPASQNAQVAADAPRPRCSWRSSPCSPASSIPSSSRRRAGLFHDKAEGSLVMRDGQVAGSTLIGQPFTDPGYFWSRPSATSPYPIQRRRLQRVQPGPHQPRPAAGHLRPHCGAPRGRPGQHRPRAHRPGDHLSQRPGPRHQPRGSALPGEPGGPRARPARGRGAGSRGEVH